jgi:two-component system chemotaxis family response regulator WspR
VEALKLEHRASPNSDFVTISIGGMMTIPQEGFAPADLIHAADEALYEAKHQGKNRALIQQVSQLD